MEEMIYPCIVGTVVSMLLVAFIGWRLFLIGQHRMGNVALGLSLGVLAMLAARPPEHQHSFPPDVRNQPWEIRELPAAVGGEAMRVESLLIHRSVRAGSSGGQSGQKDSR